MKDRLPADRSDRGPYDPEPPGDADLWFLPGPGEQGDPDRVAPSMLRADRRPLVELFEWQAAEAAQAAALARVAARFGALDERLRRGPDGWRHRQALMEAVERSWLSGDRISAERLALWHALRLAGVQEDAQGLARAGWAFRRLAGGPGPEAGLAVFLGRQEPEDRMAAAPGGRLPEGEGSAAFVDQIRHWSDVMAEAGALHPISRAAFGFHLWASAGLSAGSGAGVEAGVVAARVAAQMVASEGTGGAVFLPLALGGAGGLRCGGSAPDRLARWYAGAEQAVLAAMRHLDRLEAWTQRAGSAAAARSGRTPLRLIEVLASWPLVSAPMAEAQTGASRAAVQRNLIWVQAAGLIREVTGQGRYRFWTAQL